MKITSLELANIKRIKAFRLVPTEKGLTIIGGKNGQGKTSVLDAIAYAFGGAKYRPSNLKREGSVGEALIHVETDNGLIIERKGKNADLHVTDKSGIKRGQAILDELLSDIAINLPKFHNSNAKEKATLLLRTLGIEDKLAALDREEKSKFDTRTSIGREADQKEKAAKDMPYHEDLPEEPVSIAELLAQQKEILAANGVKEEARRQLDKNKNLAESYRRQKESLAEQMKSLEEAIATVEKSIKEAEGIDFTTEDTTELEKRIADFEETNQKIRENKERARRENEADTLRDQYDTLTREIEDIRARRISLLDNAEFPLEGLSVGKNDKGETVLLLDGKAWDCMSGSQQLIVDCAIASKLNPECRFVLLDKLEQLDLDTLRDFGEWLENHDLQCIATRVSTNSDGECSIIIEDGEGEVPEGTVVVPKKSAPAKKAVPKALSEDDI